MQATSVFLPVDPPVWAQQFTRWALARSVAFFPTTLHVEEELRLGRPYVVGAHRACSHGASACRAHDKIAVTASSVLALEASVVSSALVRLRVGRQGPLAGACEEWASLE